MENYITLFVANTENLNILKYHTLVLSIICSKYKNEDEKIFNEESIEILKVPDLIENM